QQHCVQLRKLVGMPEKMPGVGSVVAHEAEQCRAVAFRVMAPQFDRCSLVEGEVRLQVPRHRLVDLREDVRRGVMEGVVQVEDPELAELQPGTRGNGVQRRRISVPTPSSVRTSRSSACSTRPSMMWQVLTPFFTASSAELILGSMPPEMVPLANSSSTFFEDSPVRRLPFLSSTPGVLVSTISFSAFSISATLPATRSALML